MKKTMEKILAHQVNSIFTICLSKTDPLSTKMSHLPAKRAKLKYYFLIFEEVLEAGASPVVQVMNISIKRCCRKSSLYQSGYSFLVYGLSSGSE